METPKIVYLTVTEDDIRNGHTASCYSCPLALAGRRRFNLPDDAVSISEYSMRLFRVQGYARYIPSRAASAFVRKFDSARTVEQLPKPGRYRFVLEGEALPWKA